jgi:Mrp family chromosome partitioning ATPase
MREILRAVEGAYDLVIVDTPPTSIVSDAIPLMNEVSGLLVVARLGTTTRDSAAHLRDQLKNLGAPLLGVVVNSLGRRGAAGYGAYGGGYDYDYGSEYTAQRSPRRKAGRSRSDEGFEPPADPVNGNGNGAAHGEHRKFANSYVDE